VDDELTVTKRPDPRLTGSWCREGVAHDHNACGWLWNPDDPVDVEAAARWAAEQADTRRDAMRRAAEHLRNPYLCNWDTTVAAALADWLDDHAAGGCGDAKATAVADALLASFGVRPPAPERS
jgi:hypothetical protein